MSPSKVALDENNNNFTYIPSYHLPHEIPEIYHYCFFSSNLKDPLLNMPAIRHASKRKAPPAGFSDIEDDLLVFANKMKDAESAPSEGKPRHQVHWPIFRITHERSRYVYELYYEREAISRELYEWLLKNGYANAALIAKWKKMGYEKVCV